MGIKSYLADKLERAYEFWTSLAESVLSRKHFGEVYEGARGNLTDDIAGIWDTGVNNLDYRNETDEVAELRTKIGRLEKEINEQRVLNQFLKIARRKAEIIRREADYRVAEMRDSFIGWTNAAIEKGYNPLNGERNGRYAFIDRRGKVTSMSKKAQRVFGYKPGEIDYHNIVSEKFAESFSNIEKSEIIEKIPIKIKEGSVEIRNVVVTPWTIRDVYLGTIVEFRELGVIERIREKLKLNVLDRAKELGKEAKLRMIKEKKDFSVDSL